MRFLVSGGIALALRKRGAPSARDRREVNACTLCARERAVRQRQPILLLNARLSLANHMVKNPVKYISRYRPASERGFMSALYAACSSASYDLDRVDDGVVTRAAMVIAGGPVQISGAARVAHHPCW